MLSTLRVSTQSHNLYGFPDYRNMNIIMNFSQVSPSFPHSDKLRELVYLGIPHSMRAPVSTDSVGD